MARTSVREYAVLYTGKGARSSSGGAALGGNALLATPAHALDGLEHSAASDLTRLDASVDAHGLMPKGSGDAGDVYRGDLSQSPVTVEELQTVETDTALVAAPDGAGGVEFRAETGASSLVGNDIVPPQSTPLPPRVKPTGSGQLTANAQGQITIDSGAGYKAFPGLAFLEGRLHLVYRSGTQHDSDDGVIKYRYSDDLGLTWSAAVTISSPTVGDDLRDPWIIALSSGRLVFGCDYKIEGTPRLYSVLVRTSDNRGQSWSSEYTIPSGATGNEVAGTSQPIELPDGSVLVFGNVNDTTNGTLRSVAWKSTDGCLTFPTEISVANAIGTREYAEPQARLLASGEIVCLMRSDTNQHTWRTVSTDGGATWSAPADVLTASSRPDFVEIWPGVLAFFGRNNNTQFQSRRAVSWDKGVTWTSLTTMDGSSDVWMYGAPVVLAPGFLLIVYAIENSATDCDLVARWYQDGYGIDPLGNQAVLSSSGGGSFGTPALTLGTSNAAGAASTGIRTDATIATFDATVPPAVGTAATGSAGVAARRDHVHPTGAGTPSTQALGDAAATGSGPAAAMTDHKHAMPALSTATPLVESGAGAVGTAVPSSREDHVHPAAAATGAVDHIPVFNVEFNGDGATTAFELPAAPFDESSVIASVAGVIQDVVLSGTLLTTMTFGSAPAAGTGNVRADIIAAVA